MQTEPKYTALLRENRTVIDTNEAAFHLGRKPQTLRKWACHEDGPLRPVRIMGRLAWNVADIMRIVSEGSAAQ
ncbi:DNA-binding protein [Janthinobacterium sp. MDB2-8]|uniref:DNA-binding protein n=1 Tax=Janthinobacterium sp. MDB2-8 TaxID=1259338 RepID=UPI003F27F641